MKLEITYTLTLNEKKAKALKTLLGNMSDPEFAEAGITGDDREILRDMYYAIPRKENE